MKILKNLTIVTLMSTTLFGGQIIIDEMDIEKQIIKERKNVVYIHSMDLLEKQFEEQKSVEILKKMNELISMLNGYKESQVIQKLKQDFTKKYVIKDELVKEVRTNINDLLDDRRNQSFIKYEEEINQNKRLIK